MAVNIISILAMAGMFFMVQWKAQSADTRQIGALPLGCAVMEIMTAGALTPHLFPLLTILLIFLRVAILFCCALALKKDSADARRRSGTANSQSVQNQKTTRKRCA